MKCENCGRDRFTDWTRNRRWYCIYCGFLNGARYRDRTAGTGTPGPSELDLRRAET